MRDWVLGFETRQRPEKAKKNREQKRTRGKKANSKWVDSGTPALDYGRSIGGLTEALLSVLAVPPSKEARGQGAGCIKIL